MEQVRTVVLYGRALSLSAIGASLIARPGWQVEQIDAGLPAPSERLRELRPNAVLFDLAAAHPEDIIPLLQELRGLLLIGVDLVNHQALVLSGDLPSILTSDDLIRLIEVQPTESLTLKGEIS
jgi:hypothetical protein